MSGQPILFLLPAGGIEALPEVALAVKEPDADEGNIEVGRALDVVSGEDAEAAGIDRNGFMQAELGGKIRHGARAEYAGVGGSPGAVRLKIFLLAAIRVIDAAVQHEFAGAPLDFLERHLLQQRNGIVVEFAEAHGIEIAEEADAIVIPTPPEVARERPEALLGGRDEAVEHARVAHHGRDLRGGFHQHADLFRFENAGLDGLDHEHALEHAAIDERHSKERLELLFARLAEELVPRVLTDSVDGDRMHLFGDQAGETFMQRQTQRADAFAAQAEGGGENEVGAIRLQQISGTDIGVEAPGNQGDHVHQSFGGLAAFSRQIADFL